MLDTEHLNVVGSDRDPPNGSQGEAFFVPWYLLFPIHDVVDTWCTLRSLKQKAYVRMNRIERK